MNWQHLKLIVWLRWRISYNQWRRAGTLNLVLTVALAMGALVAAVLAFFVTLVAGCFLLPKAEPDHVLIMWDLIIVSFLFLWSMGVVTELQRSEFLSLDKMLHFPISPTGAFLLNYLSSLVSFAIILFLPAMTGLGIASVATQGPAMLLLFPLLFGFLLVVSALTYQFRGWMATLMRDKRRRRTIIALVTVGFVLITQVPNFVHLAFRRDQKQQQQAEREARNALPGKLAAGEIDPADYIRQLEKSPDKIAAEKRAEAARRWDEIVGYIAVANVIVPVGWLPYGARAAATGNPWPGLLGSLGLCLLGAASLWRSHRATMRVYTGQFNATAPRRASRQDGSRVVAAPLLEGTIPGCSEHVSAIVLAGLRTMLRAPETKLALISPLLVVCVCGTLIFLGPGEDMPVVARPFLAVVAIGLVMLGVMQLMVNMFGSDRGGFRAFVLMPVPRRDILLGKNLAIAPFAGLLVALVLGAMQIIMPQSTLNFAATLIQCVPAYLLYCLVGNMTSIFAPVAVSLGSTKPVQPKFWPMLLQVFAMMTMPVVLFPAIGALGVELLLDKFAGGRWFPLYLTMSLIELPLVVALYRFLLTHQGRMLQRREAEILRVVSSNVE